jgi:hypothetical protein
VPWRDCQACAVPHRTLASLQRGGIAIFLLLDSGPSRPRTKLRWPPRLRSASIRGPIAQAPERIGYFGRSGLLRGFTAQLFVYFGRRHPTPHQLARAQAELNSASLP